MKVFAGLVAAAYATVTQEDCPNAAWEPNTDADACVPLDSKVDVRCSATGMVVTFHEDLLYVSLDSSHSGTASSTANTLSGDCTPATSSASEYEMTIPLDSCGTSVAQTGGEITFSNSIVGNVAAVTVDGIVITETLQLDVECVFDDTFELTVDNIGVDAADHELDGDAGTGVFSSEFTLQSFTDSGFTTESSTTNTVVIGKPVYNRVTASNLPTNIDYFVTDCTAQDAKTSPTAEYEVINDGCLDNLLSTTIVSANLLGGDATNTQVDFSFNGFTFAGTEDTVYLVCDIILCATDSNGDLVDATCGADKLDGSCNDPDSTLGYTIPA